MERAEQIAAARQLCTELQAEFKQLQLETRFGNRRLLPIAFAWANQVHRYVRAALILIDNGLDHEALILQRQALEFTVRLHWLCQLGDKAVDAVMVEHKRSMETLASDAGEGPLGIPDGYMDELRGTDVDAVHAFGSFQAACDALGLRDSLYTLYRHLSKYCHPTYAAAVSYLVDEGEESDVVGVTYDPSGNWDAAPVMLAALLVWSQRAVMDLLNGKPRRKRLQAAARSLGIKSALPHMVKPPPKKASQSARRGAKAS